jgi:hypothetical protein
VNRKLIVMTCVGFLITTPAFAAEEGKEAEGGPGAGAGAAVVAVSLAEKAKQLRDLHLTAEAIAPVLEKQNTAFLATVRKTCESFNKSILDAIVADRKALVAGSKAVVPPARYGLIDELLKQHEESVYSVITGMVTDCLRGFNQQVDEVLAADTSGFAEHVEELGDEAAGARLAARR